MQPGLSSEERRQAGVLWATGPGLRPTYLLTGGSEVPAFELSPATESMPRVRIVDPTGRGIEGAELVQLGRGGWHAGAEPERAAAVFSRRYTSDGEGRAEVHATSFDSVLIATKGAHRSLPFALPRGVRGEFLITLGPTFRAGGKIAFPEGRPHDSVARVTCFDLRAGRREAIARTEVAADGSWGPLEIAWRADGTYALRLDGGPIVPEEQRTEAPAAASFVLVDFEGRIGTPVAMRASEGSKDTVKTPLAGVLASVIWRGPHGWVRATGISEEDGYVVVEGCPSAVAWVRAEKEGFITISQGGITVPLLPGDSLELWLQRSGSVRGTCTSGGEPVRDFQVAYWTEEPFGRQVEHFHDRLDGSFELRSVPQGRVSALAVAPDLPESEVLEIEVLAGESARLDFELPSPIVGRGLVLDQETEEPIRGAYVLPYALYLGAMITAREPRHPVGADGSFRLELFSARTSRIEIGAPGYPSSYPTATPGPDGEIDFGVTLLARTQTLEVRLEGSRPLELDGVMFQADGPTPIPYTPFPPDGVLSFDGIAPGFGRLFLYFPNEDGSTLAYFPQLVSGREWIVRFPFAREPITRIEVIPKGPSGNKCHVSASHRRPWQGAATKA